MKQTGLYGAGLVGLLGLALGLGTTGCGLTEVNTCLAAGTVVATPGGDVPIEDLRVGDRVFSVDPRRGTRHVVRITAVRSAVRPCLCLDTAAGQRVLATAEHPFYVPEAGRYVKLASLRDRPAVSVLAVSEKLAAHGVTSIRPVPGARRVYDLTVDGPFHNFLANGVLVHNKSPPADPPPHIADVIAAQNAATMDAAVESSALCAWDAGTPLMLTRDPFIGGVGIVHVTSAEAFDALCISIGEAQGSLNLTLPAATTTVDVRVSLAAGLAMQFVEIAPLRSGGTNGPPAGILLPADG